MIPKNKLKKNKYKYCKDFTRHLHDTLCDTNIFTYQRYVLYRDVITVKYYIRLKNRNRKGVA